MVVIGDGCTEHGFAKEWTPWKVMLLRE